MRIKQCIDDLQIERACDLQVISPLAEGADRIVAEEGLTLGYQLVSPLPFPREEYEHDFESSDSRSAFRSLLEKASQIVELPGARDSQNEAYEAVGRWVLDHSDVLIAIWNGKPAAGQGGTGQIVQEALDSAIPVTWIAPESSASILRTINPIKFEDLSSLRKYIINNA